MLHPLRLAHGQSLAVSSHGVLMGVLNVTPDSFSDGGRFTDFDAALAHAVSMADAGARIIDVGAESTRPGAKTIDGDEERGRLLPVVIALSEVLPDIIISVDTYRAETARQAVAAGAHLINDVCGLHGGEPLADIAAQTGAGLMIMHTNRDRDGLMGGDVIADQKLFLTEAVARARRAGVADEAIMLDPGFGFGKDAGHNFEIMARFGELAKDAELGRFWWGVGTSRKRMIGHATGRDTDARDVGTAATTAMLRMAGARVFRVHDVAMNADALAIADATLAASEAVDV